MFPSQLAKSAEKHEKIYFAHLVIGIKPLTTSATKVGYSPPGRKLPKSVSHCH
jgi:nitrate reductase NapE component